MNRIAPQPAPARVFHASPFAVARVLCPLFLVVVASLYGIASLLMPLEEVKATLIYLLPLIGIGILGEFVLAFALSRLSPVRIDEQGITIKDAWGRRRSLSWQEIQSVKAGHCLSAPYLKLASREQGHAPLILPLELTRPQTLLATVQYFADPSHPVRRFLEGK